jgi:hypothetical protein
METNGQNVMRGSSTKDIFTVEAFILLQIQDIIKENLRKIPFQDRGNFIGLMDMFTMDRIRKD